MIEMIYKGVNNVTKPALNKNIGVVSDIDEFTLKFEIEEYVERTSNKHIEIELLQGKESTEGLFQLKLVSSTSEDILTNRDSLELVNKVFSISADEVYVNFAAHIIYFITLNR